MRNVTLLLFMMTSTIETNNKLTQVILFNGRNLNGWTLHGTGKWYVESGDLICENSDDKTFSYLSTNKNYKNFELILEFKQEKAKGNSGVFVYSVITDDKIKGWQAEIGPPGHSTTGIYESEKGWLMNPEPKKDKVLKVGDWNQMRIKSKNDQLITWLNGTQMVNLIDVSINKSKRKIALQLYNGHNTKIRWRNIQLTNL